VNEPVDTVTIFSLKREALREIVGAVNTMVEEGDVMKGMFLTEGHDTAVIELSCGAALLLNLGILGKDHASALVKEREDFHNRMSIENKGGQ
tara:strand:- start:1681 stop:1956 length:276 start_codon:yes stop_codon:yes gene_type:complete